MELYVLDNLLRRDKVIDIFESMIWTERFQEEGDFELKIHSTNETRSWLTTGTQLAINESYRVMEVDTVENITDAEGRGILKVQGFSKEAVLRDRVAKESLSSLNTSPKWVITNKPAEIARKIFHDICILGILDPGDVIPFVIEGTIFPEDTILEPIEPITREIEPQTVYDAISSLCKLYDLGFRLIREFDTSRLYFDIYSGSDRTTGQTILPPVVFAADLDNLQNTTQLDSIANAKNVAYVFSKVGFEMVYPLNVDPEVEGFERKVLLVKADDIETTDPVEASYAMIQRGKEELNKHRTLMAFDGELNQNSEYKYGVDYNLGDLVEMRNSDGYTNKMRVTEQIFVSDAQGERSYPTLAVEQFVNPGTWLSWDFNKVWAELGDEAWSDLP